MSEIPPVAGETVHPEHLYRLFVHPHATTKQIANTPVEQLARTISYRRKKSSEAAAVMMNDMEIARAISRYAQDVQSAAFSEPMNEAEFVQDWLAPGETITGFVNQILWTCRSSYPVSIMVDNSTPPGRGSIFLTNRRLILVSIDQGHSLPRWYSATGIVSLAERPPKYAKDRQRQDYPYQAEVTLNSGVILVLETPKDNVDHRGRALSMLLVNALLQLGPSQLQNHVFQAYAAQYEEEKRKRDNGYYDTNNKDADK